MKYNSNRVVFSVKLTINLSLKKIRFQTAVDALSGYNLYSVYLSSRRNRNGNLL